jgi:hypothetical protein
MGKWKEVIIGNGLKQPYRDANWYRDLALFWPFFLFSVVGIALSLAHSSEDRILGLKCAGVAAAVILLAKERVALFFGALGFFALRCFIGLCLHGWNWKVFVLMLATGIPFLIASRHWRDHKLAYDVPDEISFLDMLVSIASLCLTFVVLWKVSH